MTEEKIKDIIAKLLFKDNGKWCSANYNHVRKLAEKLRYMNEHPLASRN